MTTPRLSSEKLLDTRLYKNLLRRRLPHILVAFLTSFFTVSVPLMLWAGDLAKRLENGIYTYERYIERAMDNVRDTMTVNLVFMFVLGIYFGIITLGYMMKRRSAHFYHALPQSRETLYTTSVLNALSCVAIGGLATVLIALVQLASFSLFTPEILGAYFLLLAKNVLYFLLTYAITVFAGSFSGNGLVQALMSLVILFYPIATYAGIVLTRSADASYFWESYYYSEEILAWLSPAFYAGWYYWSPFRVLPTVVAVLAIAALLLGGLAVYKKRAIENSERPIVFKKLGTVLKFAFMFTVTMFAGLFFRAIGYTFFHTVFGYVCGAVLSFMLFNTILAKSPKAMFKGIKGLAIFLASFALFYAIVGLDIFGVDDYVPSAEDLAYAKIRVSNAEYGDDRFDDPEMLAALSALLKEQRDANEAGTVVPLSQGSQGFHIYTVMYTRLGMPVARRYSVSKYTEGAQEFLARYANDARMQEKYTELTDVLDDLAVSDYEITVRTGGNYDEKSPYEFAEFYEIYKREYGVANYERLSKPVVAVVSIDHIRDATNAYYSLYDFANIDYPWTELPVFADMTETIAYLQIPDKTLTVTVLNEYDREVSVPLGAAYVYDTRTPVTDGIAIDGFYSVALEQYPRVEIDKALGQRLGDSLIDYERGTAITRVFSAIDTDYVLRLCYGDFASVEEMKKAQEDTEAFYVYDEYGVKYATTEAASRAYDEYTFTFPKGEVPAEVKALFE